MGRNVVQESLENQNFPYIDTAQYSCLPSTQSRVQVTVTNGTAPGRQPASHRDGTDKHTLRRLGHTTLSLISIAKLRPTSGQVPLFLQDS